jgi:hypothetical protein
MAGQTPIASILPTVIASSDKAALCLMGRALRAGGIDDVIVLRASRDWKNVGSLFDKTGAGRLMIASDGGVSSALLQEVRRIVDAGGWVGVWTGATRPSNAVPKNVWIAEQLLFQQGASLSPYLSVSALAARLHPLLATTSAAKISVSGRANWPAERLKQLLVEKGFSLGVSKNGVRLFVREDGEIFTDRRMTGNPLGEPEIAAEAVKSAARHLFNTPMEDPSFEMRRADVELIAQPPPRVLSEIASKRLLAAFGMSVPFEQLCQSPSEAGRVAASRPGLSVLKLVKPRLENKEERGAVMRDINGSAPARRAAQILESLGASMGPPPPLGILTADQVDGGLRVWVQLHLHPVFGRILLLGKGDKVDTPPLLALGAKASCTEILTALLHAGIASDGPELRKLVRSIFRLGILVSDLKGRINRAEIHPLVASSAHPEALVLDALAAVGPDSD